MKQNPHKFIATNLNGTSFRIRGGANWTTWLKKQTKLKCFKERRKWRFPWTITALWEFQKRWRREENKYGERVCLKHKWPYSVVKLTSMQMACFSFSLVTWQNRYLTETTWGKEAEIPLGKGACAKGWSTSTGVAAYREQH